MRLWTLFRKSGVSFEADWIFRRSRTPFRGRPLRKEKSLEFRGGLAQNLEADWYFEGLEFRGGLVFRRSGTLVRNRPWYFEGPELEADQR
ncbi:hypothetical protein RCL_jg292.t1 [Rhizophagus clarus]|nr:hypothetical protein RCL_jg292.t1 [Rhizophagus clarus]